MCWKCEHPRGTIEEYLDSLRETIRDHRWVVQYVESPTSPSAYTIGLHDLGHPELLITGLAPDVAARVLNSIGHMIADDGTVLVPGTQIDYEDRFLIEVIEVDHPDVHLTFAVRILDSPFRAVQLVWADNYARWPWDPGWDNGRRRQPVFGVRAP